MTSTEAWPAMNTKAAPKAAVIGWDSSLGRRQLDNTANPDVTKTAKKRSNPRTPVSTKDWT